MKERRRRLIVTLAKLALAAGVVFYVVWSRRVDFGELGAAFARAPGWIVAGFAVLLAVPLTGLVRWLAIARVQGIALGVYQAFRIQLIGVFFNAFLLGSMGGDVLRAYYIATGPGAGRKAASVTTVLLDRMLGVIGFLAFIGCGLVLCRGTLPRNREFRLILALVGVMAAGWGALLVLLLLPLLRERRRRGFAWLSAKGGVVAGIAKALNDADEAVQEMRRHPWASLFCVVVSAAGQLATTTAYACFGMALGMSDIPFRRYAVLAPLVILGAAVPLPGGALGVGELLGSIVFRAGAEAAKWVGGTVVLLWRIGLFVPGPLGFVYFVLHRDEVRAASAEGEAREEREGSAGAEARPAERSS